MKEPVIRPVTEDDLDEFWNLRLRGLKENPDSFGGSWEESVKLPAEEIARRLKSTGDNFVLGAFHGTPAGMVGFFRSPGLKVKHKGTIWGMYVAPESRGKGLGRKLMQAAIARVSKISGVEQIVLTVVTTNEVARNLYSSLGFISYGIEKKSLKIDDRYYDEDMMVLDLSKKPARRS